MRCLMVSSYPPMKCGIGAYAHQMVKSLTEAGNTIDVLSPYEGEGKFRANLQGNFNLLKLIKYSKGYDKIIIQYHESFFYPASGTFWDKVSRLNTNLSFFLLFLVFPHRFVVILHEIPYTHPSRISYWFERVKWALCPKILFHTQKEIDAFESCYFRLDPKKYRLHPPDQYFTKNVAESKDESRKKLRVTPNAIIFLCIGFIQPHKGFDRALTAFANTDRRMELYIVGSVRVDSGEYRTYVQQLKESAQKNPNTFVIETFISDEDFDRWINASDVLILPYRQIWSSSVLARAKLFNKPVIASHVGGLENQVSSHDILFHDDAELCDIIHEFSSML